MRTVMLSIFGRGTKLCDGITRREMLRVGGLAIGGLTLADVLRQRAVSGKESSSRGKSVIMVWLRGGPGPIDSYHMKPGGPPEIPREVTPTAPQRPRIPDRRLKPRPAKKVEK